MKERVMQKLMNSISSKKSDRLLSAENMREQAYSIPEISKAQKAYASAKFSLFYNKADNAVLDNARKTYLAALEKYGYTENSFLPTVNCVICNDTGVSNGKLCACARNEYIKMLAEECDIEHRAPFSFRDFNPVNADEKQKEALGKLYKAMESYVDKYPAVKHSMLLFLGATGTGKSCLASAMVRKSVLEYGRSALKMTAYELNNVFLTAHTSFQSERQGILHDVMTVDMLVIDDLGTEPMLKNVTVEYLQVLIEERNQARKTTIITTNMNGMQIMAKYGERIFSRISDKSTTDAKRLSGNDMRLSGKA